MKILTIDIETAPNTGHLWSLWNQTISLAQLRESSYTLCWAAKWYGEKDILFGAEWKDYTDDWLRSIYDLIDEADVVVGYNQDHFDIKTLNKDFALHGWGPPSPYQSIDLYKVVKKNFRFPSNKLDYVSRQFKIGGKVKHEGHGLWVRVMAGDTKAEAQMEKYCKGDVYPLTEKLYDKLIPWVPSHPNRLLLGGSGCTRCTNGSLTKAGFRYTQVAKYQTYRCNSCGGRSSDTTRDEGVSVRSI